MWWRARFTEPHVTIERLLANPSSFSNLPAFLDLNGSVYALSNFRLGKIV